MFLTMFLTVGGVFTFWCALKNYDWFFNMPGFSKLFIDAIGRRTARLFYLLVSLILFGWGVSRIANPPPTIPTDFIYQLATPEGIDLTKSLEADAALRGAPEKILHLQSDESGWVSFWWQLDAKTPFFQNAAASTTAGPDFREGFHFPDKSHDSKLLGGRVIYFDSNLVSCDNVLFSKQPLKSASFAMVICNRVASRANGSGESLSIFYCRAGSPLYQQLIR